ncbi:MAG: large conductance mechanosensitive channel protein MscL [Arenicellales bacterium]
MGDFKKFILRGNVLDMAVGIVIGAAFGTIVKSFVEDVIMPPIGILLGGIDFSNIYTVIKEGATAAPYATLEAAKEAGAVTMNWGSFINTVISFLIIAAAIFMVVKAANKMQEKEEDKPAAPPVQEVLLTEIRDLLKK